MFLAIFSRPASLSQMNLEVFEIFSAYGLLYICTSCKESYETVKYGRIFKHWENVAW